MVLTPQEFYGVVNLTAVVVAQEFAILDSVDVLEGWSLLNILLAMFVIDLVYEFIMDLRH